MGSGVPLVSGVVEVPAASWGRPFPGVGVGVREVPAASWGRSGVVGVVDGGVGVGGGGADGGIGIPEIGPGVEIGSGGGGGGRGSGDRGLGGIGKVNINSLRQSEILRNIGRGL